jgi:hypothetical protein
VFEVGWGDFDHVELPNRLPLMIAEKGEHGTESGAESSADFWRVGTDNGELAVVDLELILPLGEVPHLARAFWSPITAVKTHDERKASRELGQFDKLVAVIRKL